ncbi:UDP-glucuronosyl/UDP-glucosyltransferase [Corchorus olitorius]|uniref:UDP-glucuronosyl/UDP-glucosyltransferase n=1 Tax=Corchorus olitorius TaxID=93759 RepID=A0A1R3KJS4_9ROSI|nr:UDP-glucuronosyl/UDP-glucosyltransferase [Corchorus olitorius]
MSTFPDSGTLFQPHIALFPSAGMGHLTPFLRLASMLLSHNCKVTLITTKSTVSVAESTYISSFLSTHPEINHIEFQVPPMEPSNSTSDDPFFIQFEATSRSSHLIHPLISSLTPPISAIFSDFVVLSGVNKVASVLGVPNFTVSTTSVKFLSLMAYLPILTSEYSTKLSNNCTEIEIPGLTPLPISSFPPPFFNPNHIFTATLVSNARALKDCKGIFMNTFDFFEPETLSAINSLSYLPPILPIGPLQTYEVKKDQRRYLPWLNNQPEGSVVFVSFGSRTAMSKDQIRELRDGLEKSGYRFLWLLKTKKVDKDDKEDVEDLLSISFIERTKEKGMVLKEWVNQQEILGHPAIGGFENHCGWNSVMEAAQRGIPMLGWPQHGDQRVNAEVLEKAGLGIWDRTWGWGGQRLVRQDEIRTKVFELMTDEKLKSSAKKVGEEARNATARNGGSSTKTILEVIQLLKQNKRS